MLLLSVSIPYVPPAPVYISMEDMAQRIPDLGYQVYFADTQSTREIEGKVSLSICFACKYIILLKSDN